MESITSLSFYLPRNIKHEIKLEKKAQQGNTDIRGSPNMGYVHMNGCIFHYYENRSPWLRGILTYASHQAPSPNHVCTNDIHNMWCVMNYNQHIPKKGLLHLCYIPRYLGYNTSHNTCGINEFLPLYIEIGYKGYNYNDACGITLVYNIRVILCL